MKRVGGLGKKLEKRSGQLENRSDKLRYNALSKRDKLQEQDSRKWKQFGKEGVKLFPNLTTSRNYLFFGREGRGLRLDFSEPYAEQRMRKLQGGPAGGAFLSGAKGEKPADLLRSKNLDPRMIL